MLKQLSPQFIETNNNTTIIFQKRKEKGIKSE